MTRWACLGVMIGGCHLAAGLDGVDFTTEADGGNAAAGGSVSLGGAGQGGDGAQAGAGVGGQAGHENCLNGADDDGDGLLDCEDPDCQRGGFICVSAAPAGWTGPVARADAPFATASPPCPAATSAAYSGHDGLAGEPASCSPCACGDPSVSCTLGPISAYNAQQCAIPPGPGTFTNASSCTIMTGAIQHGSYVIPPPVAVVGSCAPSGGGIADLPAHTWDTTTLLCQVDQSGVGCPSEQLCVAPTPDAYESGYCIFAAGDLPCEAPFINKTLLSDGVDDVDDNRDCNACSCGNGAGSCAATTRIYGSLNVCNGALKATVPNDGDCHNASNILSTSVEAIATIHNASGSCPPLGGEAAGAITPSGPFTTVCCTP